MKAARVHEFGGPEVLQYESAPDPRAAQGEALIRVRACGINHVELDIRAGISRMPMGLPAILGLEFAGEVVALGEGTDGALGVGEKVVVPYTLPCLRCGYCQSGRDNLCERRQLHGVTRAGGYADLVTTDARFLMCLPSGLSFEDAAAGQVAFSTAWHVLLTRGKLAPGQTVLIQSGGSGVGSAGIQVAKFAGARVIATSSTDEKLQRIRELGADHALNHERADFMEEVLRLTDGRGVDLLMQHVGGDLFDRSLRCLRPDGIAVVVGGHAGEVVPLDIIPLFRRQLQIIGSSRATQREIETVLRLLAQGTFRPVIDRALDLREASSAHQLLAERKVFGKLVLIPAFASA
jgi:NADPH:quinone reductase-like Zn-dependent oxidoreductase